MTRRRHRQRQIEEPGFGKRRIDDPPRRHPKPGPTKAAYLTGELTIRLSQALVAGDAAAVAHVLELLEYVVGKAEAARIARELEGGAL
jgi:hypothetical protein